MTRRMPSTVRTAFQHELNVARTATISSDRWVALERAHLLSQPWPGPHTRAHAVMFGVAVRERDRREAVGQVIRLLVAAPGSVLGCYPEGNTGRANIAALLAEALTPGPGGWSCRGRNHAQALLVRPGEPFDPERSP